MKSLNDYAGQSASQEYQNAFNRYQTDTTGRYNREMGLTNVGLTGAEQEAGAAGRYGTTLADLQNRTGEDIAGIQNNTAQRIAELQTDLASAQASGDVAKASAITDSINGILKSVGSAKVLGALGVGGAAAIGGGAAAGTTAGAVAAGMAPTYAALGEGAYGPVAADLAASSGAAGGGAGALSTIAGLATNPITIAAAAAVGGALLVKHFVGQGRRAADVLTKPGGMQHAFEDTLKEIDSQGLPPDEAWQRKTEAYNALKQLALEHAKKGSNEHKVVSQMFDTISPLFGETNPLRSA